MDEASNSKDRHQNFPHHSKRIHHPSVFTHSFPTSNNEDEYKEVLARLRAAITLGVTWLEVQCDSSLVVNQVSGEYVTTEFRWQSTYSSFLK